jgi:glyoxylase-like metal-dependent hydrolase (beta-lactamase superfamily II)
MSDATIAVDLRYAGSCGHPEGMVLRGASWRPVRFPSLFAVLRHERHGITLFDTGYTSRFQAETRPFPARVYRWLTPVTVDAGASAAEQLAEAGVDPAEVERIVLSHFHADHIAGARDFPRARFVATRAAYEAVTRPGALGQLLRGFLPGLLPDDFASRADLLEDSDLASDGPIEVGGHDLFGDGSLRLVPLPGHAAGQIGALIRGGGGRRLFLVADAAWTTTAFRENRPPHPLAGVIMDESAVAARTLALLHELAARDPALDIVPSHCPARAAAELAGAAAAKDTRAAGRPR